MLSCPARQQHVYYNKSAVRAFENLFFIELLVYFNRFIVFDHIYGKIDIFNVVVYDCVLYVYLIFFK